MYSVVAQIRLAHTDIPAPDFDYYRKKELKDPTVNAKESEDARKTSSYMLMAGKYIKNY